MDDGLLGIVALEALPYLVEDVEHVVHGIGWLLVALQEPVEKPPSTILCDEARQRLRLNEGGHHHLDKLLFGLLHPSVVYVVFQAVKIVLDNGHESLVVFPVEFSSCAVHARPNALQNVAFRNADEGVDLVNIRKPEDAWLYRFISLEVLLKKYFQPGGATTIKRTSCTITCCWTPCMTLARKRSLSCISPYFHISFVTRLMR